MSTKYRFSSLVLVAFGLFWITACGAKTESKDDSSSIVTPTGPGGPLGECNRVNINSGMIAGQVGTFYKSGKYVPSMISMNLTTVPAEIFTSSTLSFYFLRFYERTAGNRVTNQVTTRFYFVDKLTGSRYPTGTGTVDRVNKVILEAARSSFGWTTVSLSQFFQRAGIVLIDVDISYDALTVSLVDSSFGAAPYSTGDVLLPPFYANPTTYRNRVPVPNLYSIHPNYSQIASGGLDSDYIRMINEICQALAGAGSRVPASIGSGGALRASTSITENPPDTARGLAATQDANIFKRTWTRILQSFDAIF